jgi:hypothetical protein
LSYGQAAADRFAADAESTFGGQLLVADATLLTAWLQAKRAGDEELMALIVRRFTPDYRAAFEQWLAIHPFENPNAPPGPGFMPEFKNPHIEVAKELNTKAAATFAEGTEAREVADFYVRDTVLLASVLFVVAIAQRFKLFPVRLGANILGILLLVYTLHALLGHPRL